MTPIKQGKYDFKKESLTEIRNKLGLSQRKMAELLGIPPNTLFRWEKGDTAPDAKHLAAIYSFAKEHGITPVFFNLRTGAKPFQYNLIVLWDFQTAGTPGPWVQLANNSIVTELKRRFAGMTPIFKAFAHPSQEQAIKELEDLDWRVWVSNDAEELVQSAKSDSGQNPEGTVLLLISTDGGLGELIDELRSQGVRVYVMTTQMFGNQLLSKAGPEFSIPWFPMALEPPKRPS